MKMNSSQTKTAVIIFIASVFISAWELIFLPDISSRKSKDTPFQNNSHLILKNQSSDIMEKLGEKKAAPFVQYVHRHTYIFTVSGEIKGFHFEVPLPSTDEGKQYVTRLRIRPEPAEITDSDGNKTAVFDIPSLSAGVYKITIDGISKVRTYNIKTAKLLDMYIGTADEKELARYLAPEKKIESGDEYVKDLAAKLKGAGIEETAANIYKYLQNTMIYTETPVNFSARKALTVRYGKCTEYSSAMTALLRAAGIPARVVTGDIARASNTPHNWVEVYYDGWGWVTYDPSVKPEEIKLYAADGAYLKSVRKYNTSPDNIQYIKSGINVWEPYKFQYLTRGDKYGSVSIKREINIEKL